MTRELVESVCAPTPAQGTFFCAPTPCLCDVSSLKTPPGREAGSMQASRVTSSPASGRTPHTRGGSVPECSLRGPWEEQVAGARAQGPRGPLGMCSPGSAGRTLSTDIAYSTSLELAPASPCDQVSRAAEGSSFPPWASLPTVELQEEPLETWLLC